MLHVLFIYAITYLLMCLFLQNSCWRAARHGLETAINVEAMRHCFSADETRWPDNAVVIYRCISTGRFIVVIGNQRTRSIGQPPQYLTRMYPTASSFLHHSITRRYSLTLKPSLEDAPSMITQINRLTHYYFCFKTAFRCHF